MSAAATISCALLVELVETRTTLSHGGPAFKINHGAIRERAWSLFNLSFTELISSELDITVPAEKQATGKATPAYAGWADISQMLAC